MERIWPLNKSERVKPREAALASRECSSAVIELVVGHNFHVKRGQGYFIRSAWNRRTYSLSKKIGTDAVRRGASFNCAIENNALLRHGRVTSRDESGNIPISTH